TTPVTSPSAIIPVVTPMVPTSRRPTSARVAWRDPGTRNPAIAETSPRVIARLPDVAGVWRTHRYDRRWRHDPRSADSDVDRDLWTRVCRRNEHQAECER